MGNVGDEVMGHHMAEWHLKKSLPCTPSAPQKYQKHQEKYPYAVRSLRLRPPQVMGRGHEFPKRGV